MRTKANVQALIETFEDDLVKLRGMRQHKRVRMQIARVMRYVAELKLELQTAPEGN